jgi:hypothetical protein
MSAGWALCGGTKGIITRDLINAVFNKDYDLANNINNVMNEIYKIDKKCPITNEIFILVTSMINNKYDECVLNDISEYLLSNSESTAKNCFNELRISVSVLNEILSGCNIPHYRQELGLIAILNCIKCSNNDPL